jgi:hypothetical protein
MMRFVVIKSYFDLFNNLMPNKMFLLLMMLNQHILSHLSQLVGSEKTMEQFLDRLLHESVYDRRIRPFYTDSKSKKLLKFL